MVLENITPLIVVLVAIVAVISVCQDKTIRDRRVKTKFDEGYAWACGQLISREQALSELHTLLYDRTLDGSDPFDQGAKAAIHTLRDCSLVRK